MLAIECVIRIYTNYNYFRMRNIVTLLSPFYLSCLQVIMTRHEQSPLLATRYRLGILDIGEISIYVVTIVTKCACLLDYINVQFTYKNPKT